MNKMKQMKRIDIKLGYSCNNNCIFCILGDKRDKYKDLATKEIFAKISNARKEGIGKIVITGGEPTIRDDFFKIIRFAKDLGFEIIHIESNGLMFSYSNFAKKTVNAGANSFTISLHSPNPRDYAVLSNTSEENFYKVIEGINNIRKLTKNVGINCTVNKLNYRFLSEIVKLANNLGVISLNFPFLNPKGNAAIGKDNRKKVLISYKESKKYIEEAIKLAKKMHLGVSTEMVPPCIIPNHVDVIEELKEKQIRVDAIEYYDKDFVKSQSEGRTKSQKCPKCRFDKKCQGLMADYYRIYGDCEIIPIKR